VICTFLTSLNSAASTSINCIKHHWSKQFVLPYKYRNVCDRNTVGTTTVLLTTLTGLFSIFRRVHIIAKGTVSFVMPVCPSVRMEQLVSHWKDFHKILYFGIFLNICRENSSFIEIGQ
jgi:hypothetical protein